MASVSLLQRRLTIGYGRASRIVEEMAAAGILGDHKGSQAREPLITIDEWEAIKAGQQQDGGGIGDDGVTTRRVRRSMSIACDPHVPGIQRPSSRCRRRASARRTCPNAFVERDPRRRELVGVFR